MINSIRRSIFIFLALVATGCAIQGEVDPTKPISLLGTGRALLTTDNERVNTFFVGKDQRVWLTALDGKSLYRMGKTTDYPEAMLVSPGRHTVDFRFWVVPYESTGQLWFVAESEKTYVIRKRLERGLGTGNPIKIWIEDASTAQPVGGVIK